MEQNESSIQVDPIEKSMLKGIKESIAEGFNSVKNFIVRKDVQKEDMSFLNPTIDIGQTIESYLQKKEQSEAQKNSLKEEESKKEDAIVKKSAEAMARVLETNARENETKKLVNAFQDKVIDEERKEPGFAQEVANLSVLGDDVLLLFPYLNEVSNLKETIRHLTSPEKIIEAKTIVNCIKEGNSKLAETYFKNLDSKLKHISSSMSLSSPLNAFSKSVSTGKKDYAEMARAASYKRV